MENFINKYGKWVAIAVVVITFGLLAIPGFMNLGTKVYSGYEMIFRAANLKKLDNGDWYNALANPSTNKVCVIGIIALVCTFLGGVSIVFDKNSSALDILGGILLILSSLVFLSMQGWAVICYPSHYSKDHLLDTCGINWVTYVIGALQLIVGAAITYKGFSLLKQEKSNPKAVSYSYLKKNK